MRGENLLWAVFWSNLVDPMGTEVWNLLVESLLECWPAVSEDEKTKSGSTTP